MGKRRGAGLILGAIAGLGLASCAATNAPTKPDAPATAATPRPKAAPNDAQPEGVAALVSLCGLAAVCNDGDLHFTIDLPGTSFKVEDRAEGQFLQLDDLQVQVLHVSHDQIGPAAAGKHGAELLRAHAQWESDYIGKAVGAKLEIHDLGVEINEANVPWKHGLTWWFELPKDQRGRPQGLWAFVEVELADHVVGLSARNASGLDQADVVARLLRWMGRVRPSTSYVSPYDVSAEIKAASARGDKCPLPPDDAPTIGIDRRLRLGDVSMDEQSGLVAFAKEHGGVERQTIDDKLRYKNHVCHFELDYPDADWKDFDVHDVSPNGCSLNVATPMMFDRDAGEKITNAVTIWAREATGDFGRDQFQAKMVETVGQRGAKITPTKSPRLPGAVGATYVAEWQGHHFVGELFTVKRGDLLYNVHFNSTPATVAEGRKHFDRLLAGLRLETK